MVSPFFIVISAGANPLGPYATDAAAGTIETCTPAPAATPSSGMPWSVPAASGGAAVGACAVYHHAPRPIIITTKRAETHDVVLMGFSIPNYFLCPNIQRRHAPWCGRVFI